MIIIPTWAFLKWCYLALMPVLPFVGVSLGSLYVLTFSTAMELWTWGDWTLFYVLLTVTTTLGITSSTWISLVSGYFLGWYAFGPIGVSYLIAAYWGRHLGKYLFSDELMNRLRTKATVRQFLDEAEKQEAHFIFYTRLSPLLPFALTNVLLSRIPTSLPRYLLLSLAGMFPRTLLAVVTGKYAGTLWQSLEGDTTSQVFWGVVLASVSFWGVYRIFRNSRQ